MLKKCIVLTSGGIDSTTCLAIARAQHFECHTLSFDYGQKTRYELKIAEQLSQQMGAKSHRTFHLPIGQLGGSALTDQDIKVPDYSRSLEIPVTYVPARNTIFLSIALALAEVIQAYDIFIGVSGADYFHYPDCRPEYIKQYQKMANLATRQGTSEGSMTIHTPLIHLDKAATIQAGIALGIDYRKTVSCYRMDKKGFACGICNSCVLRKEGFQKLGIADPTRYHHREDRCLRALHI